MSQVGDTPCPRTVPEVGRLAENSAKNLSPEPGMPLALIAASASVGSGTIKGRDILIGHWSRVRAAFFLLTSTWLLLPSGISAQGNGQGFLFKQPSVQVGISAGYTVAHAGGPVFNHARDQLTLGRKDFDAPTFGVEVAVRGSERLDFALGFRFSKSDVRSEMRHLVEELPNLETVPIEQTTTFTRIPVTFSARFYLRDRGRAVSRFAWIPAKWAPFMGAGAGLTWYRFEQIGDFADITTLEILPLIIESDGAGATAHVFAGVDISINPRFLWTVEGRYAFGHARTDSSFNYDNLDLNGFQATIGISARF